MPNDNYFYLGRQLAKFMMRNSRLSIQTHNTRTQNIPNLHVCFTSESE